DLQWSDVGSDVVGDLALRISFDAAEQFDQLTDLFFDFGERLPVKYASFGACGGVGDGGEAIPAARTLELMHRALQRDGVVIVEQLRHLPHLLRQAGDELA